MVRQVVGQHSIEANMTLHGGQMLKPEHVGVCGQTEKLVRVREMRN